MARSRHHAGFDTNGSNPHACELRPSLGSRERSWKDGDGRLDRHGNEGDPWQLHTPPGSSAYTIYRDEEADPPALVCQVGSTQLRYQLRAIDDLHAMLKAHGDWMPLGGADEQKAAAEGSVEAWGRSDANPVGGWYGLKKGLRGRFGVYLPPLLEALGLAELTHEKRNNQMRALLTDNPPHWRDRRRVGFPAIGCIAPQTSSQPPSTRSGSRRRPLARSS